MAYQGSAAYQLDYRQAQAVPARRPLEVYEGGRGDERARHQAREQLSVARMILVATIAVALAGGLRIALTTATVASLRQAAQVEASVSAERETMSALQVERSSLSSADRIQRIASENYDMVLASEVDTIYLDLPAAGTAEANADAAQA